jgi:hypothetical protein
MRKANLKMQDQTAIDSDSRIETALALIFGERWDEPEIDELFTEIVQDYLNEASPKLLISVAGKSAHTAQGMLYLSLFGMDFHFVNRDSDNWPGEFHFKPEAQCAIRVKCPGDKTWTSWVPANSMSAAALAAIMQYCREVSISLYSNEGSNVVHH